MLRDATVGVQHQGQRSENTFNCGQRWSEFTCTFGPQSPVLLNGDVVTIHCFIKLICLFFYCSSVIATDSKSAGEWGRKGKDAALWFAGAGCQDFFIMHTSSRFYAPWQNIFSPRWFCSFHLPHSKDKQWLERLNSVWPSLRSIGTILRVMESLDLLDLVDSFHLLMGRERESERGRGGFWNRVWREEDMWNAAERHSEKYHCGIGLTLKAQWELRWLWSPI